MIAFKCATQTYAVDIGNTIHPHLMLRKSISMAAEVAHGSSKDLPAALSFAARWRREG